MKPIHTFLAPLALLGLSFGPVGHADSREWYVSAQASLGGNGSLQAPFNSLAAVQQASGPATRSLSCHLRSRTPPSMAGSR